jgi:hypothetical protein
MVSRKHGKWISESTSLGNRTRGIRGIYRVRPGQSMIVTGDLDLLRDLMSGTALIGRLEQSDVWQCGQGRSGGMDEGIEMYGWKQTQMMEEEDREGDKT